MIRPGVLWTVDCAVAASGEVAPRDAYGSVEHVQSAGDIVHGNDPRSSGSSEIAVQLDIVSDGEEPLDVAAVERDVDEVRGAVTCNGALDVDAPSRVASEKACFALFLNERH